MISRGRMAALIGGYALAFVRKSGEVVWAMLPAIFIAAHPGLAFQSDQP